MSLDGVSELMNSEENWNQYRAERFHEDDEWGERIEPGSWGCVILVWLLVAGLLVARAFGWAL